MEKQIQELIDKHWEYIKDKVGRDGKIYHDKFTKEDHSEFVHKCIKAWGFDDAKEHLEHYIEYGMSFEERWRKMGETN